MTDILTLVNFLSFSHM